LFGIKVGSEAEACRRHLPSKDNWLAVSGDGQQQKAAQQALGHA
jgi:hypothetical protein